MKKAIMTSTLALALGVTGVSASQADASTETAETNQINKAELANLALNNPSALNEKPVHEGAYHYEFTKDGYHFTFDSNGAYWTWEYNHTGSADSEAFSSVTNNNFKQEAPAVQAQAPVAKTPAQTYVAPKAQNYQAQSTYKAPAQTQSATSPVSVNAHLQLIAQRESGGNIRAVNPTSGAAGKYQFLQSTWDSVAPAQWRGVSPASAPEAVQDAAAVKLYNTAGPSQWVTA
ncbi:transglycosylase [Macrococcoides caseolyticum subsp. caseolyticum]|uniref:transglycosylase family protein n=1 Tax=Macrococcoides caseolyticum TaxID=69966 RepID=UPI000A297C56|nr:transglycosylase family protein [Macrococcus caseolyticus]ARQ04236.1 putative transglycosylase SceD precursor [Macrococcus caseolyticus]PKE07997.1 transglycosylase [Macrococcus caseolyticus]PKE17922.1 transglycosylase [Macrococcus caseolyticus]PKE24996.1 transglycosylase [Macrococcus caseolyticus]PKE45195.1 transglycosylase [Macrococcus caseolyticus]